MQNNISITDQVRLISKPSFALVEKLPNIPELFQWQLLQQDKKTRSYDAESRNQSSNTGNITNDSNVLSIDELTVIFENTRTTLFGDAKELAPEIRDLVDNNFESLLWK